MSVSKFKDVPLVGKIFKEQLLGRIPMQTVSRLQGLTNKVEKFSLRQKDLKATVKKVLAEGQAKRGAAGEIATTGMVDDILDTGDGLTTRARVRAFPASSAQLTPAEKQAWDIINKTHCFPAGTLIRLGDGSERTIEEIKFGDKVQSRDEKTGRNSIQKVTHLFKKTAQKVFRLRLSNGKNVEATAEHPFYVKQKGFVPVRALKTGMVLVTLGQPLKVAAVEPIAQAKTVYNFEVENTHTYFVGDSNVWVHNRCFEINILKHFKYGKGLVDKEIDGCHNLTEFLKWWKHPVHGQLVQQVGTRRKVMDGVYVYKYRTRKMLPGSSPQNLRPVPLTDPDPWVSMKSAAYKTVYDPTIHPDRRYLMWVYHAYQDAKAKGFRPSPGNNQWTGATKTGPPIMSGYVNPMGEISTGFVP